MLKFNRIILSEENKNADASVISRLYPKKFADQNLSKVLFCKFLVWYAESLVCILCMTRISKEFQKSKFNPFRSETIPTLRGK